MRHSSGFVTISGIVIAIGLGFLILGIYSKDIISVIIGTVLSAITVTVLVKRKEKEVG